MDDAPDIHDPDPRDMDPVIAFRDFLILRKDIASKLNTTRSTDMADNIDPDDMDLDDLQEMAEEHGWPTPSELLGEGGEEPHTRESLQATMEKMTRIMGIDDPVNMGDVVTKQAIVFRTVDAERIPMLREGRNLYDVVRDLITEPWIIGTSALDEDVPVAVQSSQVTWVAIEEIEIRRGR